MTDAGPRNDLYSASNVLTRLPMGTSSVLLQSGGFVAL